MRYSTSVAIASLFSAVKGDLHQLIVGTFASNNLYTLQFDDVSLSLDLISNSTANAAGSWIALSHDKKNLYSTSFDTEPAFVSYTLESATEIIYNTTVELGGNCTSSKAIFVVAASEEPYAVYGTPFENDADCGAVMSVDENGVLVEIIQNYTYKPTSGVHGMALDSTNSFLYSADDSAATLWTHSVDHTTGELTYVSNISGPVAGSTFRHVAIHPSNNYLYVILEAASKLAVYTISPSTGIPSFSSLYPLIPAGSNASDYWSAEVALSFSNNYLWATSRSKETNLTGYISAFSLASNGSIEDQLFLTPTESYDGFSNSVAPSGFSDRFVALTDATVGYVEIWELEGNGTSTSAIARVDIPEGTCCANVVWYS